MGEIETITTEPIVLLTAKEARELTDEVREDLRGIERKLLELYEGQAWKALNYPSWREYLKAEFGFEPRRGEQLLTHARVNRVLEARLRAFNDKLTEEHKARWDEMSERAKAA